MNSMNSHTRLFAYSLTLLLALAACQPQALPLLTPTRGAVATPIAALPAAQKPTLTGNFVFTLGDGTLWTTDANGGNKRAIFQATPNTYADFPAFSPDGQQVAFAASIVGKDGTLNTEIRVIGADGANARVVAQPEHSKITFAMPAFSADGAHIYFTQSYPVPPAGQKDEIHRVELIGGNAAKVVDDARDPNLSPDGKKIAFLRFDYTTYLGGLWIADVDGKNAKQLVDNDAFLAIATPRWSPDWQGVLFAASGPPRKKLPGAVVDRENDDGCYFAILSACVVQRAHAHGLPWDLWLVSADGSKFEKITDVGADSPQPAWSRDGKFIAFFDATGIYVAVRATRLVYEIVKGGGYGGFDWR